jgi:hypothetical protein
MTCYHYLRLLTCRRHVKTDPALPPGGQYSGAVDNDPLRLGAHRRPAPPGVPER